MVHSGSTKPSISGLLALFLFSLCHVTAMAVPMSTTRAQQIPRLRNNGKHVYVDSVTWRKCGFCFYVHCSRNDSFTLLILNRTVY
jgi:hypothetical protein